jgi:hypothetical protein
MKHNDKVSTLAAKDLRRGPGGPSRISSGLYSWGPDRSFQGFSNAQKQNLGGGFPVPWFPHSRDPFGNLRGPRDRRSRDLFGHLRSSRSFRSVWSTLSRTLTKTTTAMGSLSPTTCTPDDDDDSFLSCSLSDWSTFNVQHAHFPSLLTPAPSSSVVLCRILQSDAVSLSICMTWVVPRRSRLDTVRLEHVCSWLWCVVLFSFLYRVVGTNSPSEGGRLLRGPAVAKIHWS